MKKTAVLIFSLVFMSISVFASNGADSLMNSLQKRFNSLTDLTAEFIQTSNGKTNLSGTIFYKKENKLKIEFKNVTIISNGKTNWNYNKNQNKTIISSYDSTNPSIFSISSFINDIPSECDVTLQTDNDSTVLVLIPKNNQLNFKEAKIWLTDSNLIDKIELTDANNIRMGIRFSHYKLNQGLSNSNFKFSPPKGSDIIDLR